MVLAAKLSQSTGSLKARIRFMTTGFPPSSKSKSPQILSARMKSCRMTVFK